MENKTLNPAKVRFNCRRGMSELENILYPFFDQHFAALSIVQQQAFVDLLAAEDTELWDWLVIKQSEPPDMHKDIIQIIYATA